MPAEAPRTDRVVLRDGTVDGAPWRFAVLSDAQFVAADPDSDLVAQARRTLREVRAAQPDFLVINGDFVDTAYPADFALAKRILDEELGGALPYYYVPGNHEIMGAPIATSRRVRRPPSRVFDHNGTRFVTLNTATGIAARRRLRPGPDAARRRWTRRPPTRRWVRWSCCTTTRRATPARPRPASSVTARRRRCWSSGWPTSSTAPARARSFVGGHVGTFHADRVDGVPYVINGNSGKNPSTPAAGRLHRLDGVRRRPGDPGRGGRGPAVTRSPRARAGWARRRTRTSTGSP